MYSLADFKRNIHGDLLGGMTAAIVALPLALAFGISSGAGPVAGLYGAIIVGFFAAVFGGTATQISGPTGPMTVIMTAMITDFIARDPEQGLTLAFATVFLGGLIQIAFGLLRLGKYITMVPYPVISGFMSGIGVIIILLEMGPMLGFSSPGSVMESVTALPEQIRSPDSHALTISLIALAIVFLWRGKAGRIIPPPLLALVVATLTLHWLYPGADIELIGEIPSALPSIQLPSFNIELLQLMLMNALMLAVLGSIDSLLTSLVADNITGSQHHSDRELIGQGIGNTIAGLFGGLPGAGATMRTVVNIRSGGTGPLSGAAHALILLVIVAGLGFLFESIPLAALAAILLKVGIDIIDWPFIKRLHRLPAFPVALMLIVLLLTVFVDLITAVFVGVFIKNMVTISQLSDLQLGSVTISDGNQHIENLTAEEQKALSQRAGKAVLFRITGPISYAAGRGLAMRCEQFNGHKLLIIDIKHANIVGISAAMVLEELIRKSQEQGIQVKLIIDLENKHPKLEKPDLLSLVGKENCLTSVEQALRS